MEHYCSVQFTITSVAEAVNVERKTSRYIKHLREMIRQQER